EVALTKYLTTCSGACATLSFDVTNAYQGTGVLGVTVLDPSPWDPAHPGNDCNGDGDFTDPGDDQDCDDDGTEDVTVTASDTGGSASVVFVLDRVAPGSAQWKGSIPYSNAPTGPGTLVVEPPFGSLLPYASISNGFRIFETTVTVRYDDRDDGTGQR